MKTYYDRRAPEYDDWYRGIGRFAERDRPGWNAELEALTQAVASLPPKRTLDVACGTGFLTRHLPGGVTALDQSPAMVSVAAERLPDAEVVQGDALALPFADGSFERVHCGHFYGHLLGDERAALLAEARRVAPELVVTDSALRPEVEPQEWQERILDDGSRHQVYKRFFSPEGLLAELGAPDGEIVHAGRWVVSVRVVL